MLTIHQQSMEVILVKKHGIIYLSKRRKTVKIQSPPMNLDKKTTEELESHESS